ncbi:hypothetical protein SMICM304S_05072 [Streptomyces microflavus]
MPSDRGMQYPASVRQVGQVRRASIAAARAAVRAGVMVRTGLARSTRYR